MSYTRIEDVSILAPITGMYRNGYRKAATTTNGISFQKEDKVLIGNEVIRLMETHKKYSTSVGYVSTQTIANGMAELLTNGEKKHTLHGRLCTWRSEQAARVRALKTPKTTEAPVGSAQAATVEVQNIPLLEDAKDVISALEEEFNRAMEEEKRLAYLKFLNEEQGKAYVRAYAIGQEIKRLTH